jgi:transcriptional regulator with XRE-family HTH domain
LTRLVDPEIIQSWRFASTLKDRMKPPVLTPDLSKRARRELGLSQTDVIKATGIQAYKLKQWEARGLSIDLADLNTLGEFYAEQGVDLGELVDHINRAPVVNSEARGAAPLQEGFTYAPRPGFMISDQLTPEVVDKLMECMEENDDRIAQLTTEAFNLGFFGDVSADTESKARELIGALAENHMIFRALQGRNIVSSWRDDPRTLGEYLGTMMKASPALPFVSAGSEPGAAATVLGVAADVASVAADIEG